MPLRHPRPAVHKRIATAPVHRGPQAAPVSSTVALPFHAPNAALLIDFDNVTMGIRSDLASELKNLLSSDIVRGKVSVQRAYADWRRYPQYIVPLSESSIDLIFAPAYGSSKKNATDIRLAIDALELVFTRPEIGTFILLSGDSDFSSLVIKLKEYGKYVIGVGIRESSSELLVQNCDEYYSYNALAGLVSTREEDVQKWDPWELAAEAVQRMKRNGDVMRADRLKQVMQQIDSSFDEKNLGMSKFSRFVTEAAQRGVLSLHKMENGQFEVDLMKVKADGAAPAADVSPAPESVAELPDATIADERRGRSRRGRGRGRDRDDRRPPREEARTGTVPAVSEEIQPELAPPQAPSTVASVFPVSIGAADTIGLAGMRLTRDEAFDLLRRAVQAAVVSGSSGRASAIRRIARELLERDSESLSERNFTRILKDAHDANVIDLRRRGDDYEVAPAAEVLPIAEQLGAGLPVPSTGAPAPTVLRGMAPRGVPIRGRGLGAKIAAPPPDLLSIGVVDDTVSPLLTPPANPQRSGTRAEVTEVSIPQQTAAEVAEPQKTARSRKSAVKKTATKKVIGKTARKKTS